MRGFFSHADWKGKSFSYIWVNMVDIQGFFYTPNQNILIIPGLWIQAKQKQINIMMQIKRNRHIGKQMGIQQNYYTLLKRKWSILAQGSCKTKSLIQTFPSCEQDLCWYIFYMLDPRLTPERKNFWPWHDCQGKCPQAGCPFERQEESLEYLTWGFRRRNC